LAPDIMANTSSATMCSSPPLGASCRVSTSAADTRTPVAVRLAPTPCRLGSRLAFSPEGASPLFGTPSDPFIARRTLEHTPPQPSRRRTETLPNTRPPLRTFADASAQTDSLAEVDTHGIVGEAAGDDSSRPSSARRIGTGIGAVLWWVIRVVVVNALLIPWLTNPSEEFRERVSYNSDLSFVEETSQRCETCPCMCNSAGQRVFELSSRRTARSNTTVSNSFIAVGIQGAEYGSIAAPLVEGPRISIPLHVLSVATHRARTLPPNNNTWSDRQARCSPEQQRGMAGGTTIRSAMPVISQALHSCPAQMVPVTHQPVRIEGVEGPAAPRTMSEPATLESSSDETPPNSQERGSPMLKYAMGSLIPLAGICKFFLL